MKNISQYILEYLQSKDRVIIPSFGVFYMENAGAQLYNENKSILPPSQLICLKINSDEKSEVFVNYLAKEKNISQEGALHEIQTQIEFWKKKIAAKEEFDIPELGNFEKQDQQMMFLGKRLPAQTPDFFGLEEIIFSEIKNKKEGSVISDLSEAKEYQFSQNILWLFLLIIPISVLGYFGFMNKDLIIGNKSFNSISIKNSTHRIKETATPKIQTPIVDSTKQDSIKIVPQNIKIQ